MINLNISKRNNPFIMKSLNEWTLKGYVLTIKENSQNMLVMVNGNVSRHELYNLKGIIKCIVPKELADAVRVDKHVTVKGPMVFGKKNYLIAKSISS